LVGEKGEFFTPREVVKVAIKLVDPQPDQTIVDPACGSGGFLIYALEHIWRIMEESKKYKNSPVIDKLKSEIAQKTFFGIDKEIDLVKIAKAYMAIIGDGRSGIVQQNSLHMAKDFEGRARELFVKDDEFKTFDIILTNPPFGSKTKVLKEDAKYFDLGHKWIEKDGYYIKTNTVRDTAIQELFIERCLKMLNSGGKLAIVLPETYFHAPSTKYILEYIKKNNNIKALVDLPHNTFRPYCNAKTVLLVLEKDTPQQNNIIMAVAEEMGHDHRGKPVYRYDKALNRFTDELWDDTSIIRKELDDVKNPDNQYVFTVNEKDIKGNIYVPRYYWEKRIKGLREEAERLNLKLVPVKELIDEGVVAKFRGHGAPPSEFKGRGQVPYVRAADIVGWELFRNSTAMIPVTVYEKIKANGVDLLPKDIVFVKEGSYRIGSVAMVSPLDTGVLLNHHSIVFRIVNEKNKYRINQFYLLYLFSHQLTQKQLYNKVMIDTTLPNIGDRWNELLLPISKDPGEREKISSKIEHAFTKKWEAQKEIAKVAEEFGNLVT
jgi:type I restriction enzyme M protein